jgi:hypothetical protein
MEPLIQITQTLTFESGEDMREWIEEQLEEKLGFFVMLQEDTSEQPFRIYLHTDNEEDRTEEELVQMKAAGLEVHKDEQTHDAIFRLLNLQVRSKNQPLNNFERLIFNTTLTLLEKSIISEVELQGNNKTSVSLKYGVPTSYTNEVLSRWRENEF